ncbi:hypothetical protein [Ferruginibacter profundus]
MDTAIVTNIETELFYSIIKQLTKTSWKITIEYSSNIFDKGIDFDFYQLEKESETIQMAWTNWFEGEIKAQRKIIQLIEKDFNVSFKIGEGEHLANENLIDEMKELLDFKK